MSKIPQQRDSLACHPYLQAGWLERSVRRGSLAGTVACKIGFTLKLSVKVSAPLYCTGLSAPATLDLVKRQV
jgi:hypothetical protein